MTKRELEAEVARLRDEVKYLRDQLAAAVARGIVVVPAPTMPVTVHPPIIAPSPFPSPLPWPVGVEITCGGDTGGRS